MGKTITKKTTDGLVWNTIQKLFSKGFQFVFSILIARILIPEDYGLVAIANLFIALSDVIIDSGFSKALLRKSDKSDSDYATVFWFNLIVSIMVYLILFFVAPLVGSYYNSSILTSIIRVITLSLIINAICGIQSLRLIAEMDFKKLAILETIAMICGGVAGLSFAYCGVGVWALVAQTVIGSAVRTCLLWLFNSWRPSFEFSTTTVKQFFSFGSRLLISDFAGRVYGSVFTLTIGKKFSTEQLGLYGKADAFASAPSSMISGPLSSVSFPAMAEIQNEEERIKRSYFSMIELSAFVVCPVFLGLISIADVLVPVVLTDKWNEMIPFMRILSLNCLISSLSGFSYNLLLIKGKSNVILYIQIFTSIIALLLLVPMSNISLSAVCWELVFISFLSFILKLIILKKKYDYSILLTIKGMIPSIWISIIMMFLSYYVCGVVVNDILGLVLGIAVGFISYAVLSFLFNRRIVGVLMSLLTPYFKKS